MAASAALNRHRRHAGRVGLLLAVLLCCGSRSAAADETPPLTTAQRSCDRFAAPPVPYAPHDTAAPAADWLEVIAACTEAVQQDPDEPRFEFELGRAYEMTQSYFDAIPHYRAAADAGSAQAQRALGSAYYFGRGVVRNLRTAFELFSRAAAAGDAYAMANLGAMYGRGDFVPRDAAKALDWLDRAVAAGDAAALRQVGLAFLYGRGVKADHRMAAQYFQQAADVGDATAMRFLAAMVERGLLGPPDAARAAALRARAQAVDPNGATPNMPPSPPAANSATVAADRWHGVATSLPRCWPACSAK